jgi:hypothetical protein
MADRFAKAAAEQRARAAHARLASATESGTPVKDRRCRDTCSMRAVGS